MSSSMQFFVHRKDTALFAIVTTITGICQQRRKGSPADGTQAPEAASALQAPRAPPLWAGGNGRLRWDPSPEGLPTIPDLEAGSPLRAGHTRVGTRTEALSDDWHREGRRETVGGERPRRALTCNRRPTREHPGHPGGSTQHLESTGAPGGG